MVIVKLMGGLGNQMFQYAAGKALATRHNTGFKLDVEFLLDRTPRENFVFRDYDLDIFSMTPEIASKKDTEKYLQASSGKLNEVVTLVRRKVFPYRKFYEPHFHFAPEFFDMPKDCYLEGYWQSPKYFESIESEIRRDFSFRESIMDISAPLANQIQNSASVCINVRRADFLTNNFHGVCDMKYFAPAVDIIASKVADPHFFIFSDDPQWCIDNFKLSYPTTFVGHEHAGKKFSNYLQLLSLCKHFIIPNSSFAWWAVWLGNKDGLVIAPKTWFTDGNWDAKDLVPGSWIRLEN